VTGGTDDYNIYAAQLCVSRRGGVGSGSLAREVVALDPDGNQDPQEIELMFRMTAQEIAGLAGGELAGPGDVVVTGVRPLGSAGPTDLAFVAKEALLDQAGASRAGVLLAARKVEGYGGTQVICHDPELAMATVLERMHREMFPRPTGISNLACIEPGAVLGERVSVGAYAVIEKEAVIGDDVTIYPLVYVGRGAQIGPRTTLHPHVTVCSRAQIGADCTVHPNCVIGDEGFGYIQREGRSIKFWHVGAVRIGNSVEIRGLTSIDRGMIEDTVIGEGVKIDKHCHISHNCRIGDQCVLAGYARMAGSVTLGRGVMMGADSSVSDHLTVGDGAILGARAGVITKVKPGEHMLGTPARPRNETMRIVATWPRLPDMLRQLGELKKEVEALKKRLEETK